MLTSDDDVLFFLHRDLKKDGCAKNDEGFFGRNWKLNSEQIKTNLGIYTEKNND